MEAPSALARLAAALACVHANDAFLCHGVAFVIPLGIFISSHTCLLSTRTLPPFTCRSSDFCCNKCGSLGYCGDVMCGV